MYMYYFDINKQIRVLHVHLLIESRKRNTFFKPYESLKESIRLAASVGTGTLYILEDRGQVIFFLSNSLM